MGKGPGGYAFSLLGCAMGHTALCLCPNLYTLVPLLSWLSLGQQLSLLEQAGLVFMVSLSVFPGEGILISWEATELLDFIDNQGQVHVIQKYLERPLLLEPGHRKFDIR